MLKKISFVIALLSIPAVSQARGIEIKLADEMAELTYLSESSTFGYGGADLGFGVLFNEADDLQLNAEMMVTGNPAGNNKALQFSANAKL